MAMLSVISQHLTAYKLSRHLGDCISMKFSLLATLLLASIEAAMDDKVISVGSGVLANNVHKMIVNINMGDGLVQQALLHRFSLNKGNTKEGEGKGEAEVEAEAEAEHNSGLFPSSSSESDNSSSSSSESDTSKVIKAARPETASKSAPVDPNETSLAANVGNIREIFEYDVLRAYNKYKRDMDDLLASLSIKVGNNGKKDYSSTGKDDPSTVKTQLSGVEKRVRSTSAISSKGKSKSRAKPVVTLQG